MAEYPSFKNLLKDQMVSVSELTARVAGAIETEFANEFTWVVGEVSNFKDNFTSGHWYFSLKDSEAQISCVCFKWDNRHIKFLPESGMEVICCGQLGLYAKQGRYQLTCKYVEPKGLGADAMALEQLKDKLGAEGLFDVANKRPLPFLPVTIGVVTSPSGAAIRDILKVLAARFPGVGVLISPSRVQGDEAPAEIVRALGRLFATPGIDLIIIARGGGSKEDLWTFNEEGVAREIAKSPVPVISAIGHEVDMTIADLVADVRAATPSNAAEVATRERAGLVRELREAGMRLASALRGRADSAREELQRLESGLRSTMGESLGARDAGLKELAAKLDAMSPLGVLGRGYTITQKLPGLELVTRGEQIEVGDEVRLRFEHGGARCTVEEKED